MPEIQVALRSLVFAAFAASVLTALASWLVRTRRISPFGALGRTLRAASDPLIRPIEARRVRAGGNPVHAGCGLAVDPAGLCADGLARRADTPRAPDSGRVRLEPARRLARAGGAEVGTAQHPRGMKGTSVKDAIIRRFDRPDETRSFEKGKFDLVRIGALAVGRASYDPGWKWSTHVGPIVGT